MAAVAESGLSVGSQLLPKDTEEAEAAIPADQNSAKRPTSPSGSAIDASLSDSETESDLSIKVRHPDLYRYRLRDVSSEDRDKKAHKHHLHHLHYANFMEYRMCDIEKRVKAIEAIDSSPEVPKSTPRGRDEKLDISLDIKRVTFAEYTPTDPTPKAKTDEQVTFFPPGHKPRHAFAGQTPYSLIDVVYADERPAPAHMPTMLGITPAEAPSVQPDRVRINSPLLLKALGRMSGHRFRESEINGTHYLLSQVMLRPFKFFVAYEQKIRDEVKRLECLRSYDLKSEVPPQEATHEGGLESAQQPIDHRIMSEPSNSDRGVTNVNNENGNRTASMNSPIDYERRNWDPLESHRCVEELRVLRELLDGDLRPTFELRKQLREGTARDVSFQDLWHLFTQGAEVVSNSADGRRQIFRIDDTNGGRPYLCTRAHLLMEPFEAQGPHDKDLPKFEILAHTYESDGKVLGMCQQIFTIKRYEGSKAITSLPCYPISYAADSDGLGPRDFFIARGKRYMELARSDRTVHKRYSGLTLFMDDKEELREEVMRD